MPAFDVAKVEGPGHTGASLVDLDEEDEDEDAAQLRGLPPR